MLYLQQSRIKGPEKDFGGGVWYRPKGEQDALHSGSQQCSCESSNSVSRGPALLLSGVARAQDDKLCSQPQGNKIGSGQKELGQRRRLRAWFLCKIKKIRKMYQF